jgi:Zn-dependent protease/CBS domain-containing protein
MGGSFKLGRIFDIDVKVHWTFFLLLAFFAFIGAQGGFVGSLVAVAVILALFLCVLLHEFGHSLVAQRLGIEVPDITLLPLGGVARLKSLPEKPFDEVKIAIAGPIVNVVLAPIFFAIAFLLGANILDLAGVNVLAGRASVGQVISYIGLMNIALAVFNLIPAFPMDGGRILRGLLATRLGPVRATDISSTIGQIFAVTFFLIGLLAGQLLLALVAVFIFFGAQGEQQFVRQRETMRGIAVSDVMGTKKRTETLSPYNNFGQVMEAVIHGYQEDFPVVDDESGKLVGILTRSEIMAAAHSPDRYGTVRDLMKTDFPTISPDADLFSDGYRILQESGLRAMPVVKNGELVGMLTVDDIGQASLLRDLRRQQF